MTHFTPTLRPRYSPWGIIQHATETAPGIWFVSTPSHGGFILSNERRDAMPAELAAARSHCDVNSFEEDCEAALVVCAFPAEFLLHQVVSARRSIRGTAGFTFTGFHAGVWRAAADYADGVKHPDEELTAAIGAYRVQA